MTLEYPLSRMERDNLERQEQEWTDMILFYLKSKQRTPRRLYQMQIEEYGADNQLARKLKSIMERGKFQERLYEIKDDFQEFMRYLFS